MLALAVACVGVPAPSEEPVASDTDETEAADETAHLLDDAVVVGASLRYEDLDHDGYGGRPFATLTGHPGTVLVGGDCNDHNNAFHPGARESCGGPDYDCDGLPPACEAWVADAEITSDRWLLSAHGIGDFDADGFEDALLTVNGAEQFVLLRGSPDAAGGGVLGDGDVLYEQPYTDGYYHVLSTGSIGDFDGDGHPEVAIGWWDYSGSGRSQSGAILLLRGGDTDDLGGPDVLLFGADPGDEIYTAIRAGDVDGDGRDDVLASGPDSTSWLVRGSTASSVDLRDADARWYRDGDGAETWFAGTGDVNGDGLDDVLAGASAADAVYLLLGSPHPTDRVVRDDADARLTPGGDDEQVGAKSPAGDADGDGYADMLIVTETYEAAVRGPDWTASIVRGVPDPADSRLDEAFSVLRAEDSESLKDPLSARAAGDVDGDGLDDQLLRSNAGPRGCVWLLLGSTEGRHGELNDEAVRGYSGDASEPVVGSPTATDLDGDGRSDILVPHYDGGVAVFLGSSL